jgi:hypothetical protein
LGRLRFSTVPNWPDVSVTCLICRLVGVPAESSAHPLKPRATQNSKGFRLKVLKGFL